MFSDASEADGNKRKSANFHGSAIHASLDEVEKLKDKVRKFLKEVQNDEPSKVLNLIDALQRLGVSYHFEIEIEEAMKHIHDHEIILSFLNDHRLHDVALCFRLLRQGGYNLSSDVFTKFQNDEGHFKSSLMVDVKGMLSLYDAAHVRFHGEDVLEKALIFTTTNLTSMMKSSTFTCSPIGRQVQHSLEQPFHKGIPRLEARRFISLYQENDATWNDIVRKLAKLDFKLVQALHRQELCDISRWWKKLDFALKLPFARDRLVECYFWIVGTYFEPSYALARLFLTKAAVLTSVVDDIYDIYGTIDELKLFTDAFERWDSSCVNQLPGYMKVCYQTILDEYDEMDAVMNKEECSYHVYYAKEAMKDLVRAYLVEAKWYHEDRYIPKIEEYLSNGLVSSAYYMIATTSLVGMGKIISKEVFEWTRGAPKPLRASCLIARLINDVGSHQFEQRRGHVASAVECFMKEYGASKQEACNEINKMVEEAWKDVNEGCLTRSTVIPRPLLMAILNLTRMVLVVYKYEEDTYTHSDTRMKENVAILFIDPIDP
ncbi:hypothetical protein Sjap_008227 [Stephania japonica]|uniref:Uncharacterized protein n=1 Tax=Stephania japonica TaxID=461633 RepID=A0AAP0PAN1_9MAGN